MVFILEQMQRIVRHYKYKNIMVLIFSMFFNNTKELGRVKLGTVDIFPK